MVHGSASAPAVPSASAFNDTDIMFVRLMLPHHDQAVSMSDQLLAKRGVHPQVPPWPATSRTRSWRRSTPWTVGSRLWAVISLRGPHLGGLDGMLDENEMQRFDLANSRDGQRIS